jgi:Helicase HerA, central domain
MTRNAKTGLRVSPELTLPLEAVTQSFALLAVRGAGKSNAAVVLAEEMYRAGLPWVAVDPKGDYWDLRSSKDGTGPGLPIPVFGGLHGDLPLQPEAGGLLAELIVEENLTCVLDVSEFASKAAQTRFLTDLAERLFRLHGKHPQPRHLVLEEADEYLPQRVMRDQARCVGAWSRVVKQGRHRGLGITLVSQRSAVVNKDALTQAETLIAMRTTSPQDRRAILDWVDYHAVARELVDSLPGLENGEAWVCSPHWLKIHQLAPMQRIRFRERATFDSGATPTLGRGRKPATIADIDLGSLRDRMSAVVTKAAQEDPAALRRRIAELERQARATSPAEVREVTVEVPVPDPALVRVVEAAATGLREAAVALATAQERLLRTADDAIRAAREAGKPERSPPPVARSAPPPSPAPLQPAATSAASENGSGSLPKAQWAILTVLAQHPDGRTKRQVALQSGYAAKGGGFNNALSALRSADLIERGDPIRATTAGVAILGNAWEPLPTGPALLEHWLGQLSKAEGLILRTLAVSSPLTKEEVAARAGYASNGGGFNNALSRLRTLELVEGYGPIRIDPTLVEG